MTWANGDIHEWDADWIVEGWTTGASLSTSEAMVSTAKFAATKASTQTISSSSATKVTWPTVSVDNLGWWDSTNNRYLVKKTGRFAVDIGFRIVNGSDENYRALLYKNGSLFKGAFVSGGASTQLSVAVDLVAGDYLEVYSQSAADTNYDIGNDEYTFFTITGQPDFSIFSTYGTFEILTTTSSVKTPSASGRFSSMTSNSLALTPGTWKLFGSIQFDNSGSTPTYTSGGGGFFAANGADSASVPALLTTLSGLSLLTPSITTTASTGLEVYTTMDSSRTFMGVPPVIVRVTQAQTVYLVPYAGMSTAANSRITVFANAERLQ
jgi:hypothetical protein